MAGFEGLLTDLRWVAESDCKEQRGNRKSEDEDVSEAFHRLSPVGRSAERGACRGHEAFGQTTSGAVSQFLEETEFHLFAEIGIDPCEHVPVEGASTVPDVAEEEEEGEGCVTEGEPSAG